MKYEALREVINSKNEFILQNTLLNSFSFYTWKVQKLEEKNYIYRI